MRSSKSGCGRCRSSITGSTSASRPARQASRRSTRERPMSRDLVRIEPLAADDVEAIAALAAEIWHHHYPAIITPAQIDYMLQQRYAPALVRAELGRDGIWWDKL